MFYDSASCAAIPSLYICHVKNILGSVPIIPCFVGGNTQPTIPYRFRTQRGRAAWAADTRPDAGNGSRVYELNLWMWRYGRGQERKVSILDCSRRLFARRGRGPARRTSAGGWTLGTAPLRMRRRDSRQFASCFASLLASHSSSSGSPFPIGSSLVHATLQRVRSHKNRQCETADGVTKSRGNSAAEIHSKNLCLSNCSPRDVVIIWKFCGGNPQRESL